MCAGRKQEFDQEQQDYFKKVGRRLRYFRKLRGFSDYDKFSFAHDLNRSQYGDYEKGRNLTIGTLHKLLKLLEIDETVFYGEGYEET